MVGPHGDNELKPPSKKKQNKKQNKTKTKQTNEQKMLPTALHYIHFFLERKINMKNFATTIKDHWKWLILISKSIFENMYSVILGWFLK